MSATHVQITVNAELVEFGILCLNFLFLPTSQLLGAVKIIVIIFGYFVEENGP